MDKQLLGIHGEFIASRYLREHGYDILCANYSCRLGEIDLIAEDKKYVCFVEVKTRSENMKYSPADAVDMPKRKRIIATSNLFLKENEIDRQPRFDIIEVYFENNEPFKLNHIEGAFDAEGQ
ncbi:MAG: YraN family protein [Clostridia bacterium]|nr:YraN family protein [Clostridia bacterium]